MGEGETKKRKLNRQEKINFERFLLPQRISDEFFNDMIEFYEQFKRWYATVVKPEVDKTG